MQPVEGETLNQCVSPIWVVGWCADPSLRLCFGESLLATEAAEILVLAFP